MKLLGLDFGTKRVGAAMTDPRGQIATPLEIYARRGREQDAQHYRSLVAEHEIEGIVVGLPLHVSGAEGDSAIRAREWGAWLGEITRLPVVFHDERYSSLEAEEILRNADIRPGRRAAKRDMLAAQILLQHYVDSGTVEADEPGSQRSNQ